MPPRLLRIADIGRLNKIRLDDHDAEIRPCDLILQVGNFLAQPVRLVRLVIGGCARRGVLPRSYNKKKRQNMSARAVLLRSHPAPPRVGGRMHHRTLPCNTEKGGTLTPHARTAVPKMRRQLRRPTPALLPIGLDDPHALPQLALHRPHPTTLVARALDILAHDKGGAPDAPLRPHLLDPPNGLDRSAAPAALALRFRAVPGPGGEDLRDLLHAHVGCEGRQVGLVHALVHRRVVVLVLR